MLKILPVSVGGQCHPGLNHRYGFSYISLNDVDVDEEILVRIKGKVKNVQNTNFFRK